MSALVVPNLNHERSSSRRSSPNPTSPRVGHKRQRNGEAVEVTANSGMQTPITAEPGSAQRPRFTADASIVLVGIRGSGKRSLGFIAAAALGRRFVTEDHYFQNATGFSRQDYLRIHGSEEFHKQDVEISRSMLEENRSGCVIDCGLGSLTRALQDYLKTYCQTNQVIYVQRDMASVTKLLRLSERSAQMLEAGDTSHRKCSNFEFFNLEDVTTNSLESDDDRGSPTYSFKLRDAQIDFSNFVQRLTAQEEASNQDKPSAFSRTMPIEEKLFTHALFVHLSTYRHGRIDFSALQGGGDVVEVRIDEWQEGSPRLISQLVAEIRRYLRVPIICSATSINSHFHVNTYFAALRHGLRLVPDSMVVDLALEKNWLAEFVERRCCTQIVGAIRSPRADLLLAASDQVIVQVEKALNLGIKLVRLSAPAVTRSDSDHFEQFLRGLRHRYSSRVHFSAYLEDRLGRTTQVFNHILTPVTHKALRVDTSSTMDLVPQITAYEAIQALFSSFSLDPLHFYVFGANVSSSLSPTMHNAAYKAIGLWHDYTPINVDGWEEIQSRARMIDFGGASIAQPYKVRIVDQLTSLSEHAQAIGAINTLIPLRREHGQMNHNPNQALYRNRAGFVFGFHGDNSDWISIQKMLSKNLSPRNVIHNKSTALIVGAGGMARAAVYALLQMGCRAIFVYNRTVANARILSEYFSRWAAAQSSSSSAQVRIIKGTNEPWPAGFAQPTTIISCVTHERLPGEEHVSDFTVPEQWLGSETGGTAVEQAYYINTPFTEQIKQLRATTGKPWVVVDGLEVLHEQAAAQFEIMTGKNAPRMVMWNALQDAVTASGGKV
ncbi:hypothetical protein LTS08_001915 [Lithohypha guttulata]|uniref:Quinate repressor protein n=1 Tax=Lithohypha guttulata TaxID=1690604 RepID=A0AAN7T660_9EURO|nr:hypothetical protein LTR51_004572 [Lithohypha guttulata]KAK5091179.1 hypothetical protein LTR05_001359 [Lithohypha guttulata]KAK5104031.1 hypothetical protein LTS08_001915 [Lithohypha guttulata]